MTLPATDTSTGPGAASPVRAVAETPPADPVRLVRYWNEVLLSVFRRVSGAPGPLARTAAMLHATIFDVVNNQLCVDRGLDGLPYRSYLGVLPTTRNASVADAVNVAARDVLRALHPSCQSIIDGAFAARYSNRPVRRGGGSPDPDDPTGGGPAAAPVTSQLGAAAAAAMLRSRDHDGSQPGRCPADIDPDQPGAWRLTSPDTDPVTPFWGRVTPFSFSSGSVFRPPLPARLPTYAELLTSVVYAQQVNESAALGAADSTVRSAEQTEIAWFWAHDLDGTVKAPGHLLRITATLPLQGTLLAEARLFALLSVALADALIAAWDSKYDTPVSLWRPESAIRLAGTDGNPATQAIPGWSPLSCDVTGSRFTPASPAYVCSHAALAGAWSTVLREYYGTDRRTLMAATEDPHLPPGTVRTFGSFSEAAAESARSRLYLGVHFEFEGSVMSGTPVIRLAKQMFSGLRLGGFEGIMNGTSNYVLGRMEAGLGLQEAVREAQDLGYAEANPSADIEGFDVQLKVLILANELLDAGLELRDIARQGISSVTVQDVRQASLDGKRWKLVGSARRNADGSVTAGVAPVALPLDHGLAGVSGATNAVAFTTDLLGQVTVSGPGAGRVETAYALLSDIIAMHAGINAEASASKVVANA